MTTRRESDLLGPVDVPEEALYGAQTQRAVENFPLRLPGTDTPARSIGSFPHLITALLQIKKAAARTNQALGSLPPDKAQALEQAADLLLEQFKGAQRAEDAVGGAVAVRAAAARHFPVHFLHGGGGTSANMNANEVLANLGEELLGGRRGAYNILHPNDHANLHQSTNDVYPTACHMAVIAAWPDLKAALLELAEAFAGFADADSLHLARTCLQDAVEIRFADYFGGIAAQIRRQAGRLDDAVDRLHAVNLGGTICGRGEDVPAAYLEQIIPSLCTVTGDPNFTRAPDLFDAAQNPDELAAVSGELDRLARSLVKIAKDLRLLGSGPQAGLNELRLPPVQPGSSIMPGKINPVMPEFLIQVCFRVTGSHAMCAAGLDHGELDLNVWESSMVFAILESFELLGSAVAAFTEKCVRGLSANRAVNTAHTATLIPRLTRLMRQYGYERVSAVCKAAGGDLTLLARRLDEAFDDPPAG